MDYKARETSHSGYFKSNRQQKSYSFDKGFCSSSDLIEINRKAALKRIIVQMDFYKQDKDNKSIKLPQNLSNGNERRSVSNIRLNKVFQKNIVNPNSLCYTMKTLNDLNPGHRKNITPISGHSRLLSKQLFNDLPRFN